MPNELIYYAVINNGINMTARVIQKNKKKTPQQHSGGVRITAVYGRISASSAARVDRLYRVYGVHFQAASRQWPATQAGNRRLSRTSGE